MKDIKKMWMVTPDLRKKHVDVLYDKDNGNISNYCSNDDNDFYSLYEGLLFYESEKEADKYIQERLNYLMGKDKEVLDLIAEMYLITTDNKKLNCQFKTVKDVYKWCDDHSNERTYLRKQVENYKNVISRLCHALKSGYLNIDAYTFQVEDVTLIKWLSCEKDGKKEVEITLSNGKTIDVTNETELDIIRYVYGENSSGYVYKK